MKQFIKLIEDSIKGFFQSDTVDFYVSFDDELDNYNVEIDLHRCTLWKEDLETIIDLTKKFACVYLYCSVDDDFQHVHITTPNIYDNNYKF